MKQATAFAPASVGNVAVGYDLLGHALEGPGDRVTARRIEQPEVRIAAITGSEANLPLTVQANTAGRAVASLHAQLQLAYGFELTIAKGIPLGSGLGGSAASATAALLAANALLDPPLPVEQLYAHALEGEAAASGGYHGDNVGPQLLGGLVLATPDRVLSLPVPTGLTAVVVHPALVVETRQARSVLDGPYDLESFILQNSRLAIFIRACYEDDAASLHGVLEDALIEPRRAALIPGFDQVKHAALQHGALGATISGAGPSVVAWFADDVACHPAGAAMADAFAGVGLTANVYISPVAAAGARLL